MQVVVTGAAGFIGTYVCRLLQARGYRVVGIDRRPIPATVAGRAVRADLAVLAPGSLAAAELQAADGVIHLAGAPGVRPQGRRADRQRWRDNVVAGARLLETVPDAVPAVVASSSSVYGGAPPGRGSREHDVPRPRGAYAATKLILEGLAAARAARGGAVAVARPFTVAGEGQRPDMAIARWLQAARCGRPLEVYGSLDRRRDVTDVSDVAEGLVRLLERHWIDPAGTPAVVNLGSGVAHRLADIVAAVGAALDVVPAVTLRPASSLEPAATLADTARCEATLGLRPSTDLGALVRRQAAHGGMDALVRERRGRVRVGLA